MITQFRLFETLNQDEPKKGDWVICQLDLNDPSVSHRAAEYIRQMIGQITDNNPVGKPYLITYYNVENRDLLISCFSSIHNKDGMKSFKRKEILFWSEDKAELEKVLTQQRFDL